MSRHEVPIEIDGKPYGDVVVLWCAKCRGLMWQRIVKRKYGRDSHRCLSCSTLNKLDNTLITRGIR